MFSRLHVFERGVTLPDRSESQPTSSGHAVSTAGVLGSTAEDFWLLQYIPKRGTSAHRWHDALEKFRQFKQYSFLVKSSKNTLNCAQKKNHKQVQAIFSTEIYHFNLSTNECPYNITQNTFRTF